MYSSVPEMDWVMHSLLYDFKIAVVRFGVTIVGTLGSLIPGGVLCVHTWRLKPYLLLQAVLYSSERNQS